jgi:hypothetical protein
MEHQLRRMNTADPAPRRAQPPPLLDALATRLSRTLAVARALAGNGRTVDLSGVQDGVGRLCAQCLDAASDEGREMLPLLYGVLGELDALSAVLRAAPPLHAPQHSTQAHPTAQ